LGLGELKVPFEFIVKAAKRLGVQGKKLDRSWVVWSLVHALIFLCLFTVLGQLFYPGPGELERQIALKILDGQLPTVILLANTHP
jgi:hypothetical protein